MRWYVCICANSNFIALVKKKKKVKPVCVFQLQLSLAQKRTELEELEQNVTDLHTEKQQSQQRAALLQAMVDKLTEVRSRFLCILIP